jgi:hypothetical protein
MLSKKIIKIWHDPVWSKVIATLVLALLAAIGTYFFDWWPIIKPLFKTIIDFVFADTATPNWLLGFLIIPWVVIFIVIGYLLWNRKPSAQASFSWSNYTRDQILNLKWMWRYNAEGKITDLFSFCPHCDFQIYPRPSQDWIQGFTHLAFHCENCGQKYPNQPETIAEFENKVIRHIQLKIRNNTWSIPK